MRRVIFTATTHTNENRLYLHAKSTVRARKSHTLLSELGFTSSFACEICSAGNHILELKLDSDFWLQVCSRLSQSCISFLFFVTSP